MTATCCALTFSAYAQSDAQQQTMNESAAVSDGRTFGDGALPEALAIYDVNTNGVLSVEEIQAMKADRDNRHQDWITRWDTNQNGTVDVMERAAAQNALRLQIEARRVQRFMEADGNGDDCLTLTEFMAIPAVTDLAAQNADRPGQIYGRLDANNDDCVSAAEFTAHLKYRRLASAGDP